MKLFCFGLGYSAQYLVPLCLARGIEVAGTWQSKSVAIDPSVRQFRFAPNLDRHGQGLSPEGCAELSDADIILISIPPTAAGLGNANETQDSEVILSHHRPLLENPKLKHIIYLSTTGVYGDHGGNWVDENTQATPQTERGQRRVAAEQAWRDFVDCCNRQASSMARPKILTILRLAGIYGPGRSAFDSIAQGKAQIIIKQNQVFSRIHVADIAQFIDALMAAGQTNYPLHPIYNLCDNEPAPPQDVISYAYELLGRTPPAPINYEMARLSPMQASFYSESKRVKNDTLHEFLSKFAQKSLLYPDYRVGLSAILAGMNCSWDSPPILAGVGVPTN
ncbi:MAG: SDR family oxidoreductase [Alphaproteobacteria bacterium]|nr:SDR family oxidoreductase [Alphaproteobacteria bacterium]